MKIMTTVVDKKISFHPKLAAILDAVLNIGFVFWFQHIISSWWWLALWLVVRAALWGLFVRQVYFPPEVSRRRHFASLIFFAIGTMISLYIFLEWEWSWRVLAGLFIIFSAISFWLLPQAEETKLLTYVVKPYRRWIFMMDAFGLAGVWGGMYALLAFQILSQNFFWLGSLFGALISAFIAGWWWRVYGLNYSRRYWLGVIAIFVLMFELAWIVWFLPLGYAVNAIIMIWFWYNFWLVIRFNLTKEGIRWRRQTVYFIFNVILFSLFLLFAKWK